MSSGSTQMKQLVRQHFTEFCSCKASIDKLHQHIHPEAEQLRSATGGVVGMDCNDMFDQSHASRVQKGVSLIARDANSLYRPLLECRQEMDRIRATLDSIKRFRFLFELPGMTFVYVVHQLRVMYERM